MLLKMESVISENLSRHPRCFLCLLEDVRCTEGAPNLAFLTETKTENVENELAENEKPQEIMWMCEHLLL